MTTTSPPNPNLLRKAQAASKLGISVRQFDRLRQRYILDPVPPDHAGRKKPLFWWASVIEALANGGYGWGDDPRQTILPPCQEVRGAK